jgi:hypothetical protein
MHAPRYDELAPVGGELGDVARRGDGAWALVHRRVGERKPGQLADRGLIFEHRLQPALRYLGLIRRVGRQVLRALDDRVDQRRDVVVIHARAEERDLVLGGHVLAGERAQLSEHLLLGPAGVQRQRPGQPQARGDVGEQILDRRDADLRQHLAAVGLCGRCVARHEPSVAS